MARFTQKQSDSPETPGLHDVWRARSRLRKAIARGGERLDIEAIRAVFDFGTGSGEGARSWKSDRLRSISKMCAACAMHVPWNFRQGL
jgi:hypothetical protein